MICRTYELWVLRLHQVLGSTPFQVTRCETILVQLVLHEALVGIERQ